MAYARLLTHSLGYPRIGQKRELKQATESYWKGRLTLDELLAVGRELRRENWLKQKGAGIDLVPSNDFSFYDQVLDTSCLVGNVPKRFSWEGDSANLDTIFLVARGKRTGGTDGCVGCRSQSQASEMTKWFDTNYHYITPEFRADTAFRYASGKAVSEFEEARRLGIVTKPVLVGPLSYLALGKVLDDQNPQFDRFDLLERLLPVYEEIVRDLASAGAEWIQIDEPVLSLDLSEREKELLWTSCRALKIASGGSKILLATYFGELRENLGLASQLDCDAFHVDATRGGSEVERVARELPSGRLLSLGIVDGRNVWKNNYEKSLGLIERVVAVRGSEGVALAPSCSLLHCPVSLANETKLNAELKGWLAFADEKLVEVVELAKLSSGELGEAALESNRTAVLSRDRNERIHDPRVQERLRSISDSESRRQSPYDVRRRKQRAKLKLPAFPTTTIGSFPQTKDVRAARAKWKKGQLDDAAYHEFLRERIRECVAFQEDVELDVLVHGEFERNDMVEYFGEQLAGFAFTENGWVQSYGSRCVKPPIIFGDVSRPAPMTVDWTVYAQSLIDRPMKGMLTGPITLLQWSFVRDDQPRRETARQIALAIRDEVLDLEKAGIGVIQIDEPAVREGLPLRKSDWQGYLDWAVEAFRLTSSGVRDETQIHTHMCYSEFNDIIEAIAALDADVITIETSRSNMELLEAFVNFEYPAEIGPGVYDIHSPQVPATADMLRLMEKALEVLPMENLWVNPDCGLKTRSWEEVKPALQRMVACAKQLRERTLASS